LGSFVERRLADEAHVFVAARLIGGETAPGPLRNIGPATLKASPPVGVIGLLHLGGDICYTIRFG
jgi:riboflavin biosynthesis pyrimidine reductase